MKGLQGFQFHIICDDGLQHKANHRPQARIQWKYHHADTVLGGSAAPVDAVNQCVATEFPSGCEDHQILVLSRFPWMLIVRGFALHHKDGLTNTIS